MRAVAGSSAMLLADILCELASAALDAAVDRQPKSRICIHHSDRGDHVRIRYGEHLARASSPPSEAVTTAAIMALAETVAGLYKTELIHRRTPWKTRESVELTLERFPGTTIIG